MFSFWPFKKDRSSRPAPQAARSHRVRLEIESLETRDLMSAGIIWGSAAVSFVQETPLGDPAAAIVREVDVVAPGNQAAPVSMDTMLSDMPTRELNGVTIGDMPTREPNQTMLSNKPLPSSDSAMANGDLAAGIASNGVIIGDQMANGAVFGDQLANGVYIGDQLRDGVTFGDQLANGALFGDQLANGVIGSDQLANGVIISNRLPNGVMAGDQLRNSVLIGDQLADGVLFGDQLANGVITVESKNDPLGLGDLLRDGVIVGDQLRDGVIIGDQLRDGVIVGDQLRDDVDDRMPTGAVFGDANAVTVGARQAPAGVIISNPRTNGITISEELDAPSMEDMDNDGTGEYGYIQWLSPDNTMVLNNPEWQQAVDAVMVADFGGHVST